MKTIGLIITILLESFICSAQDWTPMIGIEDMAVNDIIEYNEDTLLAGVDNYGIYISYDGGSYWNAFALQGETIHTLIKIGTSIMAGTENGIFKTNTINSTWYNILDNSLVVNTLKTNNDTVFACTYSYIGPGAVYFSADTGYTWNQYGTIPPYAYLDIDFNPAGRIYVSTPDGAEYTENQSPWIHTTGNYVPTWTVTYIGNDSILYGGDGMIYLSTDNGVSSYELNGGAGGGSIFYINDTVYFGSGGELKYSNDLSQNWKTTGLYKTVKILTKIENKLFAGTASGIYMNSLITRTREIRKNNIKVLPNPTSSVFRITGIESSQFTIDIYNLSGQKIYTSQELNNDISQFESGLYIMRITLNNSIINKKIIKE